MNVSSGALREFFDLERGLLHTIGKLFRRPGTVARDFISGATARYISPFKYFVVTVTAGQIVAWRIGVLRDVVSGFMEGSGDLSAAVSPDRVTGFITDNLILLSVLALPGTVLTSRVLFRSARFNVAEILTFYLYVFGQISLLFVLVAPFASLLPRDPQDAMLATMMLAQLLYFVGATVHFFGAPLLTGGIRAVVVATVALLTHLLLLMILVPVVMRVL